MPEHKSSTISDVVKFSIPELSVDQGIFAAAAGKAYSKFIPVALNANGKYVPTNPAAAEGSETEKVTVGILMKEIATDTNERDVRVSVLRRMARISLDHINWSAATWTDAQKTAAKEELAALFIVKATEA